MRMLILLAVLLFCNTLFAQEDLSVQNNSETLCEELFQAGNSEEIMKRGCCSHHGGVCGCGGTKLRCCDGTNSPSCKCYKPDDPITTPKTDMVDV